MNHALSVFDNSTYDRNVFAWNAIIAGFIANGLDEDAFLLYQRMWLDGVTPDKFTFPSAIKACSDLLEVRKIHGALCKVGLAYDPFSGSSLAHSYLEFGLMEVARKVFEELPLGDVVLLNSMINGYARIGKFDMALDIFGRIGKEGLVPSDVTVTGVLSILSMMGDLKNGRIIHGFAKKMGYESGVSVSNSLIDMYGKCKCTMEAVDIFETMVKDIFSWNIMIYVYEQSGDHVGTLRIFERMLGSRVLPDLVTVTTVVSSCSHLAALMLGKQIHGYMIVNGLGKNNDGHYIEDAYVTNAMMDMYAKCGSTRDAYLIFNSMTHKDVASWNIMIMGYGMHGYVDEALDMFSDMCASQLKPDEITFVGILSICSHAGLLVEGREILAQMASKYNVVPTIEHYTCVIDMLGRAGKLEEAHEILQKMPIEPNPIVWRAFLAGCRQHGNLSLAEMAAFRLLELEPNHCGSYVLISNVYGATCRYEEVSEVRHTMREQNLKKIPGCSWIELTNGIHPFVTGDKTHPEADFIYAGLNSLTARLREHGYVPNS